MVFFLRVSIHDGLIMSWYHDLAPCTDMARLLRTLSQLPPRVLEVMSPGRTKEDIPILDGVLLIDIPADANTASV